MQQSGGGACRTVAQTQSRGLVQSGESVVRPLPFPCLAPAQGVAPAREDWNSVGPYIRDRVIYAFMPSPL